MPGSLDNVFNQLKIILKDYEKPPIYAKANSPGRYELWSQKQGIMVNNKPRSEMFFAGLVIQKNHVGLYYMPLYTDEAAKVVSSDILLKHLKGKTCFHIKELDNAVTSEIKQTLKLGYQAYQLRGWV